MACPTCDHTLTNLGSDQVGRRIFWCPRCGTLKTETKNELGETKFEEFESPKLVQRSVFLVNCIANKYPLEHAIQAIKESTGVKR